MQLPQVILGLQPGGVLTQESAERFLRSCETRNRLYHVLCCEIGQESPESLRATDDIAKFAYDRAMATLERYPDADVGIGLQSNTLKFITADRIVAVKMAAAALICRRHGYTPSFLIVTGDTPGGAAHLVAEALSAWSGKHPITKVTGNHMLAEVVKKAVGL